MIICDLLCDFYIYFSNNIEYNNSNIILIIFLTEGHAPNSDSKFLYGQFEKDLRLFC